ncbi:formate dehydrogenase accessory sulfurtransferase FdhD [Salipiger aestuarii]|uniref:formate dehydrogenase accessory sulfurtransferase FdhD n=1 Tax=Salipiger aestuarii TaxID=568098 RepID=UPI0012393577|nr:formate dehydrogenase accessory sulfurtransferase FdhD [Salipiger aestuarii]KAA8609153.1 formate dehydrogenase [Salipiger aestuarii]
MTGLAHSRPGIAVRRDGTRQVVRALPEEVPVALVFDGTTQAVMMATPADVADFAYGFALSEELIAHPDQVREVETVPHTRGIEARIWLTEDRGAALKERRRTMLGPTGCGLCGIDSLDGALRPLPRLPDGGPSFETSDIAQATDRLRAHQPLHDQTRAVHAAGFLLPGKGIVMTREDVGRHNALDKLIGAMARQDMDPGAGAIVLTSRVSVDMVQKTVLARCPVLIAVSAPTALALSVAEDANLTLTAFARSGGFDLYAAPGRVHSGDAHVA